MKSMRLERTAIAKQPEQVIRQGLAEAGDAWLEKSQHSMNSPKMTMPTRQPGWILRPGQLADADRLAVLAMQVWLHTYATAGISPEIAGYVQRELTPENYATLLQDPTRQVLVAEQEARLLGFAVVKLQAPCPTAHASATELQTLYVQAHFAGRGLGSLLLKQAEAAAALQGHGRLWLKVNAMNHRAIAFYAHHGYTRVGTAYFELGAARHENHVLVCGRGLNPPLDPPREAIP